MTRYRWIPLPLETSHKYCIILHISMIWRQKTYAINVLYCIVLLYALSVLLYIVVYPVVCVELSVLLRCCVAVLLRCVTMRGVTMRGVAWCCVVLCCVLGVLYSITCVLIWGFMLDFQFQYSDSKKAAMYCCRVNSTFWRSADRKINVVLFSINIYWPTGE